ncbi:MAG: hypothetical protein P8L47_03765 [Candidatus Marinamargulisbacteria bacterium]|jgi:tetratricopeptide (TPR) repeat protein|nr:hypothetical protein [bacterium]MDG2265220.1 hypothetical protein [Candidatus Marinamargulisbacteria bacterium]|tara:strand:- start:510 stop:1154 length:645 start_codon:yes stop_codon:yes gene_type:complete
MYARLALAWVFISCTLFGVYYPPDWAVNEYHVVYRQVQNTPNSPTANFELAMNYAYTGRVLKGVDVLKKVKELDPDFSAKIVSHYKLKWELEPTVWQHAFKLAFGLYFDGQKSEAETVFQAVLKLDPDQVWAMGYLGLIRGEANDYDAVLDWCQKALAIHYDLAAIHFLIAEAYAAKDKDFRAFSHRARAASLLAEEKLAQRHIYGEVDANRDQ